EELVTRLVKEKSIQWVLFFHDENQIQIPKQANIKIVIAPIRHYSLAEQRKMPRIFVQEKLDLLHVPHFNVPLSYSGAFVVTIHDLLWHTQSNANATTLSPLSHAIKHRAYKWIVSNAVHKAIRVIVPAQTVKREIARLFPDLREEKIVVTYEGANKKFADHNVQTSEDSKILFYTGSLYPHKNVILVVEALKQLPDYSLYISSSRTVFVEQFLHEVEKMGLSERVKHLGRLSDDELIGWYKKSFALVQPSLSEGFGLTGIEAMTAGIPVLASNISIFNEVYKDAAITFDPTKVVSFINAVKRLAGMDRADVITHGQEVAAQYSWDTMATETLQIYENCIRLRSR
ncbi:MAG: glycosyltransferase family 1 protein, partial [Candidatus Woesebacteria bacterium]